MHFRPFAVSCISRAIVLGALFIVSACAPTTVPISVKTDVPPTIKEAEAEKILSALIKKPIKAGRVGKITNKPVHMPQIGELNSFGVMVTPEFSAAYEAYLKGDGKASLAAIDQAEATIDPTDTNAVRLRWNLSVLRVQNYIAQGLAAQAESELNKTEKLEQNTFGNTLFTQALRGEALVWLGDYEAAVNKLTPVIMALETYRLPTSYGAPPSNVSELFYFSTAQLRAYTSLAAQYLLREKFQDAFMWSQRAETLYADVFFVADHFLYGQYMAVHADSYYGRALNMSILGAAKAITTDDWASGMEMIDQADTIYSAIGYRPGKVNNQAFRAYSALQTGNLEAANKAAELAVMMARERGITDFIWRVDALRGEALLADSKPQEAETAFRSAEKAVSQITGSLSSDRAKRRFGVGKSDITYRLAQFDIANGDLEKLFADVERGRARAFVDMVAHISIAESESDPSGLGAQIRALDLEIRRLRNETSLGGIDAGDSITSRMKRRQRLLRKLRDQSPEIADLYDVEKIDLKELQAFMPKNTLLIQGVPMREGDTLKFLMITSRSADLLITDAKKEDLDEALEDLTDAIALGEPSAQADAAKHLDQIFNVADWPKSDQILIVPTGPMFFVPWGALSVDVPVSVLPNAGWVNRASQADWNKKEAVIIGDPDFGGSLPQLPGAHQEATAIAGQYNVPLITDRHATEATVRQAVGSGVDILHLATHGKFSASYPLRSAIYLSSGDGRATPLTAEKLFSDPLPARMIILSACETGIGNVSPGDDFLGLARSFYLGGAVGVLNSLWLVNDKGTEVFMRTFHENLAKGPGQAWLIARNTTRNAGYPVFVYSAFVLGGSVSF